MTARRRRLVIFLLGLMTGLLIVGGFAATYAGSRDELPPMPPLPGQKTAPVRFLSALYGVTRPLGVAVSPVDGRVYVTESGGPREIKVFDAEGRPLEPVVPPGTDVHSRVPVYVAVNTQGEVYVSDRTRQTIDVYGPDGRYLRQQLPGPDPALPWSPLGLSFDTEDRLLVTDVGPGRHRVLVFSPDGRLLTEFGRQEDGDDAFAFPNAVVASRQATLYVSDGNNGRVVPLRYTGESLSTLGQRAVGLRLGLPRGMGIDTHGRLYVVDAINHSVQVYDLSAEVATPRSSFGTFGVKDGQFNFPNGLAVGKSDRIYVTDRENNRVQIWGY